MKISELHKEYHKDQRTFFDNLITKEWGTYHDAFWDFTRHYEVKLINEKTQPQTILNIGSGCGFHEVSFAQYENVKQVVGVDYSEKSIEMANKHYPHLKVERFCMDVLSEKEKLNSTYDVVTSFQVIEHLEESDVFLTKMKEAARKDGWVVIATPNFDRLSNRIRQFFRKERVFCDRMHYNEFTINELKTAAEAVGLTYVETFGYGISFNVKYDLDKYIPNKVLFYLGRFMPKLANVIVLFFKKA